MQTFEFIDGHQALTLVGDLLGYATSERPTHTHDTDKFAYVNTVPRIDGQRPWKCSACRWYEVRIVKLSELDAKRYGSEYAVYTIGQTRIPGETPRSRVHFVNGGYEMVEILTDRRQGNDFIPVPAQRALAQAAHSDAEIERAYVASVA